MGQDKDDGVYTNASGEAPRETMTIAPAAMGAVINVTERAAEQAWNDYRAAVGGKAFNGDPLPDWATMVADEKRQSVVAGWRSVASGQYKFWRTTGDDRETLRFIRDTVKQGLTPESRRLLHDLAQGVRELDKEKPGWDSLTTADGTTSPAATAPPVTPAS